MTDPFVQIIILNFNGWKDTIECLESLSRINYSNFKITVVDNGSIDSSFEKISGWKKGRSVPLTLIRNNENLGFVQGNNGGIQRALEQGADYIMLLNNDTVVDPDFLAELVKAGINDNQIGIASSKILFYQDRKKIWFVGGKFVPIINKPAHEHYGEIDANQVPNIKNVDWVSGCCMFIRSEVFKKIGMLDPDYFFSHEDVDFCVRARQAGFKIAVVPSSRIYHKFAASARGKFSPFYTYFRTRNTLLFYKKSRQWISLCLNFLIYPFYSVFGAIRNKKINSIFAVFIAVVDFIRGNYGIGSAKIFQK